VKPRGNDTSASMRDFWDQKARENVMYCMSSYRAYHQRDPKVSGAAGGPTAHASVLL
jgi:hypothetical protein